MDETRMFSTDTMMATDKASRAQLQQAAYDRHLARQARGRGATPSDNVLTRVRLVVRRAVFPAS